MNTKAFEKLDYTLALLSAADGEKRQGCIVSSLHQATSSYPVKFTVTVSRDHETYKAVQAAGSFSATLLAADCPDSLIHLFGYKSGRVGDKFTQCSDVKKDAAGNPYLTENMAARISCRVLQEVDLGRYALLVGEVTEAEVLGNSTVLTLQAFASRGRATPVAATSYRTVEVSGYRCTVCGFVYEGESLPPDFRCPLCNAPASKFEKIEK